MNIIREFGEIDLKNKNLSLYQIYDLVKNDFNVRLLEENDEFIKLKIIRTIRLYAFPTYFFPQARLFLRIDFNSRKIQYCFEWREYYLLLAPLVFVVFVFTGEISFLHVVAFWIFSFVFMGFAMLADTRIVIRKLKKVLT